MPVILISSLAVGFVEDWLHNNEIKHYISKLIDIELIIILTQLLQELFV